MTTAQGDVTIVAANFYLRTGTDHFTRFIYPYYHVGFLATVTDSFQFLQHIGPGEQPLASRKQLTLKICANPIAEYRDGKNIADFG